MLRQATSKSKKLENIINRSSNVIAKNVQCSKIIR